MVYMNNNRINPKIPGASTVSNFQTIGLCKVAYKVIKKP